MNKEEVQEWLRIAEEHDLLAKHLIGTCYEFGKAGLKQDYEKAMELYAEVARWGGVAGKEKIEELRASQCPFCGQYKCLESLKNTKVCKKCGRTVQ